MIRFYKRNSRSQSDVSAEERTVGGCVTKLNHDSDKTAISPAAVSRVLNWASDCASIARGASIASAASHERRRTTNRFMAKARRIEDRARNGM